MLGHLRLVALLLWAASPPGKGNNSRIHPAWRMKGSVGLIAPVAPHVSCPRELHDGGELLCLVWPDVGPALEPTKSWAPGSAPTVALTCCVNYGVKYSVKRSGGDGKADWRGSGMGVGGMEPARCRDTSGPSCRHVEGLAS